MYDKAGLSISLNTLKNAPFKNSANGDSISESLENADFKSGNTVFDRNSNAGLSLFETFSYKSSISFTPNKLLNPPPENLSAIS